MISPFDDLQQVLQQRRQSTQKLFADTRAQSVAMSRSPEEFAGAGLGNLFGQAGIALYDKFFNKDKGQSPEDALLEQRSRDQKGLFTDLSTQHANVSTPDGGMRTETTPRSQREQLQARANKFMEYAETHGDPEAFRTAMLFNQQALDMERQERNEVVTQNLLEELGVDPVHQAAVLQDAITFSEAVKGSPKTKAKVLEAKLVEAGYPNEEARLVAQRTYDLAPMEQEQVYTGEELGLGQAEVAPEEKQPSAISRAYDGMKKLYDSLDLTIDVSGKPQEAYITIPGATDELAAATAKVEPSMKFDFNAYLDRKGIDVKALSPEEKKELYMKGLKEHKVDFKKGIQDIFTNMTDKLPTKN